MSVDIKKKLKVENFFFGKLLFDIKTIMIIMMTKIL